MLIRLLTTVLVLTIGLVGVVSASDDADTVGSLSGVEITTSVDLAEMYIGDLINYTVTITYDSTLELVPPPLGANLGMFDVKDYDPDEVTELPDGRIKSETVFTLSTFTTGDWVIPPVPVTFILPDDTRKTVLSEAVPIMVKSMLENAGDTADVAPLKPPYEFKRDYIKEYSLHAIIAAVVIGLGILVWYFFFRRKEEEEKVDLRPPWEIAFEKLARLKEAGHLDSELFKEYYTELTEIARDYLGRIYDVDVLEMTTGEFVDTFEDKELPDDLYGRTSDFLKHADFVKFARFVPERSKAEDDYLFVHELIDGVRVDYERKLESETRINHTDEEQPAPVAGGGQ